LDNIGILLDNGREILILLANNQLFTPLYSFPMPTAYHILSALFGIGIGYLIFYLRYQYRDTVNELRSHLKEANKQIQYLQEEVEEFSLQNGILKEKAAELLDKNDELNDVVAELSKYYVHIKKASEKSEELSRYLTEPDEEVEEKIRKQLKKDKKSDSEKMFF
jgi:uncharacterized protein YoxC